MIIFEIFLSCRRREQVGVATFVQTLAVPGDPALDNAVLGSGLQDELVEVAGPGHVPCAVVLVTVSLVVSA